MLEIEDITAADIQLISPLFVSVFSNPPWDEYWELAWAYKRLHWIYQSQGFVGYTAVDGNHLVGAILRHCVPFQGKKGFPVVEFLVQSDRQDRGVGTELLKQLELNLNQDNYDFVFLLTARDSQAESFYSKRNYQQDSKIVLLNKKL